MRQEPNKPLRWRAYNQFSKGWRYPRYPRPEEFKSSLDANQHSRKKELTSTG